jgi:hypothetical protein
MLNFQFFQQVALNVTQLCKTSHISSSTITNTSRPLISKPKVLSSYCAEPLRVINLCDLLFAVEVMMMMMMMMMMMVSMF